MTTKVKQNMNVKYYSNLKQGFSSIEINGDVFYYFDEITIELLGNSLKNVKAIKTNKGIKYINAPCSFDIETTSFYDGGEKRATMYVWQANINGISLFGRTWEQFLALVKTLSLLFNLSNEKRLIIYIHNLSYEFQFFRKYFNFLEVFAREKRKPIYATILEGIEFRCSYIQSGYSLDKLAKNLEKYKIEKLKDSYNYNLIRHSQTPLTVDELNYCYNDVKILEYYIREEIDRNGDITKIPLTQTGYVRRLVRNACYYSTTNHRKKDKKYRKYRNLMKSLTIEKEEYEILRRVFAGGFTHANAIHANKVHNNVGSFDFASSYPAIMINEKFPMTKGEKVEITSNEEFDKNIRLYACVFYAEFENLESITMIEHPLSSDKCISKQGVKEDNGRIVEAKKIIIPLTNIDYSYLHLFYKWDSLRVFNFWRYEKQYLPTDMVKVILELYKKKTELKDLKGYETEYMHSKELINSCYGMMVTNIVTPDIIYKNDEWDIDTNVMDDKINKYNQSKNRFLFYPWGVFVTSYARRNLFTGIYEFGDDYIYSDTDSVKGKNYRKHLDYINNYNDMCIKKSYMAMDYHKIPHEYIKPKTKDGKEKPLGVWEFDGEYSRFKTLGAKRYMIEQIENNEKIYSLTVAGVNKKLAIPYLVNKAKKNKCDIFDLFSHGLYLPPEHSGKLTLTYIDDEISGNVTDYLGNIANYCEKSCIHMEKSEYNMSLSDAYLNYLLEISEY